MLELEEKAKDRCQVAGYAGELTPKEAWNWLEQDATAQLVDVRTPPEWVFAGLPDLGPLGKKPVQLSWKLYPAFTQNDQFAASLNQAGWAKDTPIFFLCRTGGRSLDAAVAMSAQGYTRCFNITDGFDGPPNDRGQRGTVAGWRANNLPWHQG